MQDIFVSAASGPECDLRLLLLPDGGEDAVLITNIDAAGSSAAWINLAVQ
jgi:hypothetical protein